jgi:hypothetical protein
MSRTSQNKHPSHIPPSAHRRAHLRMEFGLALVLMFVFSGIKLYVEHTAFGEWLHAQANVWLQSQLHHNSVSSPVAVIDISSLPRTNYEATVKDLKKGPTSTIDEPFTSREALRDLLAKVAQRHPAAIGVDIDLSFEPELTPGKALHEATTNLLDAALQLGPRVCLGIKRTEALPPQQWLLSEKYSGLAASLDRPVGPVYEMLSEYSFPTNATKLKSLARAMAGEQDISALPRGWVKYIARGTTLEAPIEEIPTFRVKRFFVDYSALTELQAQTITFKQLSGITDLQNKYVLLGDTVASRGADTAIVPGRGEPVPGVYVHACALNTLLQSPLWELRPVAGFVLGLLVSVASTTFIYRVCNKYAAKHRVTATPLSVVLTVFSIAFYIGVSVCAVKFLHVLWLEVPAVCLVLVVHCLFDAFFGNVSWKYLKQHPLKPLVVAPH